MKKPLTLASGDIAGTDIIERFFTALLFRKPRRGEIEALVGSKSETMSDNEILNALLALLEMEERRAIGENAGHAPGHFYSPVINKAELRARKEWVFGRDFDYRAAGVHDEILMRAWRRLAAHLPKIDFPHDMEPSHRYCYGPSNQMFPLSDALIWSAMLQEFRPKRVIEVGSGFSSAVLLDTQDRWLDYEIDITFIQPFPDSLNRLLRPTDEGHFKLLPKAVQDVPLSVFSALEAGDILFIDSTHVSKVGSDVNYEILEILPRLNEGVLVHFHDIFDRFEYPETWVMDNGWSWNEQYLLRAFLQGRPDFEILVYNNYFNMNLLPESAPFYERFKANPGGSLWLRKSA